MKPFFGPKKLDGVTSWDLERYKSKRTESLSKASVNRELGIIKRIFKLAVEWGFLASNPAGGVKLFREDERPIRALRAGIDLVTVKELLGHADVTTTMRYAHPTPETKRTAVDVLVPQKKVAD